MNLPGDDRRLRVLLLLPTARDSELTADILTRNGMATQVCADSDALARELETDVGAVIVGEELLGPDRAHVVLSRAVRSQPRWSDLPILLLTRAGADSNAVETAVSSLGNVTLIERPLRVSTLISTVRAALRARARQYQIESHLHALEQARQAKAEEARRKDEFLAMLAHELRNPLAPIRNALHVLEMDGLDPQRRAGLRAMMARQVDHMVRLVDDLVEASRLSQGKIALRRQPVDLCHVLREAIEVARPHIEAADQRVEVHLHCEPLVLEADPVRLAQVFGNLINNAAKYGHRGGRIAVGAERVGDDAVAWVRDDGIGIEPDLLPRVFELFTQGRRDTHRLQDGLGIGLALVRSLVDMHGGEVTAHSAGKDRGAEFRVRLPLACGATDAAGAVALAAPRSEARMRVLIVDDNVDAAESLALVLEGEGIETAVAHEGGQALAMAAAMRPSVALLDIGMPGMDGYEVARRLRASPLHDDLVLVAVTGWSDAVDQQRSREAGFDHHVSKPADVGSLLALLDAVRARTRVDHGDWQGGFDENAPVLPQSQSRPAA